VVRRPGASELFGTVSLRGAYNYAASPGRPSRCDAAGAPVPARTLGSIPFTLTADWAAPLVEQRGHNPGARTAGTPPAAGRQPPLPQSSETGRGRPSSRPGLSVE